MRSPWLRRGLVAVLCLAAAVGVALFAAGQFDRQLDARLTAMALPELEQAAKDDRRNRDPKLHYWLGVRRSEAGKDKEALQALARSAQLDPRSAATRYSLGVLLDQLKQPAEAEKQLQEAARLDPKAAKPHLALGRMYGKYGRWDQAVGALETATRLEPDDTETPFLLSIAYEQLAIATHQPYREKARALLEGLVKRAPDHVPAMEQLAKMYVFFNQLAEAESLYRKILAVNPGHVSSQLLLGRSLAEKADGPAGFAEAEKLLTAYRTRRRDDPSGAIAQGILQFRKGDPKAAAETLQEAVALGAREPETWFYLGRALIATGRSAEARAANETFARRDRNRRTIRGLEMKLTFDDGSPEAARQLARTHIEIARLQIDDGAPQRALPHLQAAAQALPGDKEVAALLARSRAK